MSCSRITNDYDGITHDYTRKQGLVYEQVFLPDHAPREWCDRSVLWNAVEQAEKTKDSRLAREFVVALPVEFGLDFWKEEVSRFADKLTDDGMCVDVCIHDTDGHNPHAHIMATVRPLNKNGSWQRKTEKEYLCRRGYEERSFTSSEFKAAETEGWEKQYLYQCGKEKGYLPPSQAEGLERISKHPKSSRYGRENPISARWNSEEQLCLWRKQWADIVNQDLAWLDDTKRIDHRSFAARGITIQPTIHEGVKARKNKKKGIWLILDRVSVNRLIRQDNEFIYNMTEAVKYLVKTLVLMISRVAGVLEELRTDMIILDYKRHEASQRKSGKASVDSYMTSAYDKAEALAVQISDKKAEIAALEKEMKRHPVFFKSKQAEIQPKLTTALQDLKELEFARNQALHWLDLPDGATDLTPAAEKIEECRSDMVRFGEQENKFKKVLDETLGAYCETLQNAASLDQVKLKEERLAIREKKEDEAWEKLTTSSSYADESDFNRSIDRVSELIGEEAPHYKTEDEIRQERECEEYVQMHSSQRGTQDGRGIGKPKNNREER